MILKAENTNWINLYNSNESKSIIIATEMILAHKLFNNTSKIVVGVPNSIDKELILNIVKRLKATEVLLYIDKYTILHLNMSVFTNIIDVLEEQNIKVDFRIAINEENIGIELNECKEDKKIA